MFCERDNSCFEAVVLWRYLSKAITVLGLMPLPVNLAETHFSSNF